MSNPGGASISAEQLKARYVGTGTYSITFVFLFEWNSHLERSDRCSILH